MPLYQSARASSPRKLALSLFAGLASLGLIGLAPRTGSASLPTSAQVAQAGPRYVSPHHYSLTPPAAGWSRIKSGMDEIEVMYGHPSSSAMDFRIYVLVKGLKANVTTQDFADTWVDSQKEENTTYVQLQHSYAELGGVTAYRSLSTRTSKEDHVLFEAEEYIVGRNQTMYDFAYLSTPANRAAHEAEFQAMLRSVRWQ